ncbi:hypothetical protein [Streptomyces sp. NBC_01174]|uniref:hypothetical protein n=1 Tax=Streptomyces sp. NBC_01174 TaxID=2903758 RepID=UPI00386D99C4|nr:hypothetical protein OG284_03755 [Streptomyces sp. NBC_01177]WSS74422.1 hypothetical protein OG414_03785 [Streptomyces sp. NBC_01174]
MSDAAPHPEVTDLGSIPGSGDGPAAPAPGSFPDTEIHPDAESSLTVVAPADVKAEDVDMFSVRYKGLVPTLVLTGGSIVPSLITVVDGSGNVLAEYEARPAPTRIASRRLPEDQNDLVCATPDCKPLSLAK